MIDAWTDYDRVLLALVAWREAQGEGETGIAAVCWGIRNRVDHPKWWGSTYSSVIVKPWQLSSMTAPGDPMLIKWPVRPDPIFDACLAIAQGVIWGVIPNPVPEADSWYSTAMKSPPFWVKPDQFITQIGKHRFYNTDGSHPDNMLAPTRSLA